jgi:pimeloyl-ACP methyl ester carboxylesterase
LAAFADFGRIKEMSPEQFVRQLMPFLFSQGVVDRNPDIVDETVAKQVEYPIPLHGLVRQAEAIMSHDTYELLPSIKLPTLVIAGDHDGLIPFENSRKLASRISKSESVTVNGAGHLFFIEQPQESNKIVLGFLERHRKGQRL